MPRIDADFFRRPTLTVARDLLGIEIRYGPCAGIIVETEAYTDDPASHWVTRPNTGRMLGTTWGRVYIYTIYGIHQCLNFTSDDQAPGAVLVRALEPTAGIDIMRTRRGTDALQRLTSGPARLYQALAIERAVHGKGILDCFEMRRIRNVTDERCDRSPRIGISRATDLHWRFAERGSRFISR